MDEDRRTASENVNKAGRRKLRVGPVHLNALYTQTMLRGRQKDETAFVFFEQAIELSRMLEPSLPTQGEVYFEYGLFREQLGQGDEARAYLEQARELFASAADVHLRARAERELQKLSA